MGLQRWGTRWGETPPALPFASFPAAASVPGQVRVASDLGNPYLRSNGVAWELVTGEQRRRWGAGYERTPGELILDIPATTPVSGLGTSPASTSEISTSVQWLGRNTMKMQNLHGGNGATVNFSFNLPAAYSAPMLAPTLFCAVYIPNYKTVQSLEIWLSMGDTAFTNAFKALWQVGPSGHLDKQRNGWHLISVAPDAWLTAAGTPAWTSTIGAVRFRWANQNYPDASIISASDPILQRSAIPALMIYADDAFSSFYNHALPIFEAYGLRINFALAKNNIGNSGYMSLAQYLDAQRRGHEICVHSTNQIGVQLATVQAAIDDVAENQAYVRDMVGAPWGYKHFAYPNGRYWLVDRADMTVVDALRDQLGLLLARTTDDPSRTTTRTPLGLLDDTARYNQLTMPEIGPWGGSTEASIKASIDAVITSRSVGSLVYHSISPADAGELYKPTSLERIAAYIAEKQATGALQVLTGEQFVAGLAGNR